MVSAVERICGIVRRRVTPSREERKRVLGLAEDLIERVSKAAREDGVKAEVRVEGSVAKDTWLSGEPDIDIFMRVPRTMPREAFGTVCLNVAKKATEGYRQVERFAEHPYLEAYVDATRVNIVPCYEVKRGEWISATDRTPFHTDYVKPLLNELLRSEIRLLKRFMKGIGVYGAEIKVGGFSGYLCELLTLNYDSFTQVLGAVADWREETSVIDYEGYYKHREDEVKKIFEDPVIVVDPVDKGRNAASAVRKERLDEFAAASREFLKKPRLSFFYPPETRAFSAGRLIKAMETRGSTIVLVRFGRVKAVPDVLWGQLYKSKRSLRKMLEQYDFNVMRDCVWSNERDLNVFVFEVEERFLPSIKRHLGPPLRKRDECERFLRKHRGAARTVSGPRVEEGRWVVEIKREYRDVVKLIKDKLRDGGRRVGIADMVSQTVAKSFKVDVNDTVVRLYLANPEFAKFLTEYLNGRPRWLSIDEK